ncbi:hypothetical protein DID88_004358 [Monilinia fructigena]|uniref:Beta-xylosidase C-terminal Concanavalin A-like domain-containing protein n=1 Tax=Monilinia fructigena TaxID=38457 RepID=A0A395ISN1_9HELO|nr:hypothetical protein DID88_004358 [Monilinia fructigena]
MTQTNTYTNPILPGSHPDPSIIRSGENYFLITSSFEYFPGIPIYHSTDLISWNLISHALTRRSQLDIRTPEPGGGIWAPTIREHEGWFYITALFFDDDGKVYLSTTRRKHERTPGRSLKDFAIHITTIDINTGFSTSIPKVIRSSESGIAEGSHIFKRGKFYYLFTAEGGTESGHCDEVVNTGHIDIVEDKNGNWWAVMLACRPIRLAEGTKILPSAHGEYEKIPGGWKSSVFVINNGKKITLQGEGPGTYQFQQLSKWRDDFTSPDLQLGWYRKNTPQKRDYEISTNPPSLHLRGSPYKLNSPACPTLLLRKQTSRLGLWSTKLSFAPTSPHMEAGTAVYWNHSTHLRLGIWSSAADTRKRIVAFHHEINGQNARSGSRELEIEGDVILLIGCTDEGYILGYRACAGGDAREIEWMCEATVDEIMGEPAIGAAFTGMMLGVYASGNGDSGTVPARFEFVEFDTLWKIDGVGR